MINWLIETFMYVKINRWCRSPEYYRLFFSFPLQNGLVGTRYVHGHQNSCDVLRSSTSKRASFPLHSLHSRDYHHRPAMPRATRENLSFISPSPFTPWLFFSVFLLYFRLHLGGVTAVFQILLPKCGHCFFLCLFVVIHLPPLTHLVCGTTLLMTISLTLGHLLPIIFENPLTQQNHGPTFFELRGLKTFL